MSTACNIPAPTSATSTELFPCVMRSTFPVEQIRRDFPIFAAGAGTVGGKPLTYLDTGASAQKPQMVIDAMRRFMAQDYANIHRGVYRLSARATEAYEGVRSTVRRFINAAHDDEIVFTRGATEAINLVANSWGAKFLQAGDEIILTPLEHHANIVPWHMLRERLGVKLVIAPLDPTGTVRVADIAALVTPRTKLIAVTHVSNVLGSILPVAEIAALAHQAGALCLVDGCQGIVHAPVDMQAMGADFYVFSGHKLYGPTGVGVLYGRRAVLATMPPWQGGGDMIATVSFDAVTYQAPPHRFEAGTPPITEVIGLGAAIDYLSTLGMARIAAYEDEVRVYAEQALATLPTLTLHGHAADKAGVLSFTLQGVHPHDIGTILDSHNVAIRAGHHCAQPLMDYLGLPATARATLGLYTTRADIDALVAALRDVVRMFG